MASHHRRRHRSCSDRSLFKLDWQQDTVTTRTAEERREFMATHLTCNVCLDIVQEPHKLKGCGHLFCKFCLYKWLFGNRRHCPYCRSVVNEAPDPEQTVDAIAKGWISRQTTSVQVAHEDSCAQRKLGLEDGHVVACVEKKLSRRARPFARHEQRIRDLGIYYEDLDDSETDEDMSDEFDERDYNAMDMDELSMLAWRLPNDGHSVPPRVRDPDE